VKYVILLMNTEAVRNLTEAEGQALAVRALSLLLRARYG